MSFVNGIWDLFVKKCSFEEFREDMYELMNDEQVIGVQKQINRYWGRRISQIENFLESNSDYQMILDLKKEYQRQGRDLVFVIDELKNRFNIIQDEFEQIGVHVKEGAQYKGLLNLDFNRVPNVGAEKACDILRDAIFEPFNYNVNFYVEIDAELEGIINNCYLMNEKQRSGVMRGLRMYLGCNFEALCMEGSERGKRHEIEAYGDWEYWSRLERVDNEYDLIILDYDEKQCQSSRVLKVAEDMIRSRGVIMSKINVVDWMVNTDVKMIGSYDFFGYSMFTNIY